MSDPVEPTPEAARAKFRTTLTRVLIVQLVSMMLLGLIQIVYNR
jgi:hypothetical protein